MFSKLALFALIFASISCNSSESDETDVENTPDLVWQYFDRQIYLPIGADISPEKSAAQLIIEDALKILQSKTDLGQDFFEIKREQSSLLQPISDEARRDGHEWFSFIQVLEDNEFSDFVALGVGNVQDEDILVARNILNPQEFFILARLSCFVSAESCGFPPQEYATTLLNRSFGFLVGVKFGDEANSPVMKTGYQAEQKNEPALRQFYADFNARLEFIRYNGENITK